MVDEIILDKIRGSLVAGGVGDALGYPVEFRQYNDIVNSLLVFRNHQRQFSQTDVRQFSVSDIQGFAVSHVRECHTFGIPLITISFPAVVAIFLKLRLDTGSFFSGLSSFSGRATSGSFTISAHQYYHADHGAKGNNSDNRPREFLFG